MALPMTRLQLRVSPGAHRSEIVGRYGDVWKVQVTAPPQDGRANEAVLRLLSKRLGVPRTSISMVSGHAARQKVVELTGLSAEQATELLDPT